MQKNEVDRVSPCLCKRDCKAILSLRGGQDKKYVRLDRGA